MRRIVIGGLAAALVLVVGYLLLIETVLPRQAERLARHVLGDRATFTSLVIRPPLQLIAQDVRVWLGQDLTLRSPRVTIQVRGLLWHPNVLWIRAIRFDRPRLALRRLQDGTIQGFSGLDHRSSQPATEASVSAVPLWPGLQGPWQVRIEAVHISDGTIDYLDEQPGHPFRGILRGLYLTSGPFSVPSQAPIADLGLALRGEVVGHQGHAAPVYCSGWFGPARHDLDVSCHLKPIRMAAFDPYFQGALQIRAYDATFEASGYFRSRSNAFESRVHLELGNLREGDVSFSGRTIVDVKRLSQGQVATLTGELTTSGPLDQPSAWRYQLAGNEYVERLVTEMIDRPMRFRMGSQTIQIDMAPAIHPAAPKVAARKPPVAETKLPMPLEQVFGEPPAAPPPAAAPVAAEAAPQPPSSTPPAGALDAVESQAETRAEPDAS